MTANRDNTDMLGIADGTPKEKKAPHRGEASLCFMMGRPCPQSEDQGTVPA